ncbi:MAG TPA: hypothetical protein VH418_02020 [Solirubrobacteraceae bacterium]|jgi:hypothetical protein
MATKRKRRTKHRGNAAGGIEARGRTGRAPTPEERKKATRQQGRQRVMKPPSWNGAFTKALVMAALLFLLTRLGIFGRHVPVSQSVFLALFAILLYTPLAYMTDRFVYQRQQRRQGSAGKR